MNQNDDEDAMAAAPLSERTPDATDEDARLVARVLDGDGRAFEHLVRKHNRLLYRTARGVLRDDAEAEEAVQETYMRAYAALRQFRRDARLATWLVRIALNVAFERLRRQAPLAQYPEDEAAMDFDDDQAMSPGMAHHGDPEVSAARAEMRQLLERSVDALGPTYRTVFILRAVEGFSVEETAAALGLTETAVKVRFHRARQQLQAALGRQLSPLLPDTFSFAGERCDRITARVCARLGLVPASVPPPRQG